MRHRSYRHGFVVVATAAVVVGCMDRSRSLEEVLGSTPYGVFLQEYSGHSTIDSGSESSARFQKLLDFAGIEYEEVLDPNGQSWIVWSLADNAAVESIRYIYFSDDLPSKLEVLDALGRQDQYVKLLRDQANNGNATAQHYLGLEMITGRRVARDYARALELLRAATENGSDASFTIGVMHEEGWGVEPSYAEALAYFRRAADSGDAYALCKIGYYYEAGAGIAKDEVAASDYLESAAAAGAHCVREGMAPDYP